MPPVKPEVNPHMNSAKFFIIEHIDQEADEEVKWKPEAPKV